MLTASSSSLAQQPALASAASMESADRASEPRSAAQIIQALIVCSSNGNLSSVAPQPSCAVSSAPLEKEEAMLFESAVAAQLRPVKALIMALQSSQGSSRQVAGGISSPAAVSEFGRSDATDSRDQDPSEALFELEPSAAERSKVSRSGRLSPHSRFPAELCLSSPSLHAPTAPKRPEGHEEVVCRPHLRQRSG